VAEYDQLNNTYTVLLAAHDELLDSYERTIQTLLDTTLELSALNQTYLDLLTDFEDLNLTYYILTGEFDALNETYQILTQQYNQLNTTYFDLVDACAILQGEYDALNMTYYQLQAEHDALQVEYDSLLSDFNTLNATYYTLLDDYATLQTNYDALQSDYDNLLLDYNILWAAHQQLESDYNTLQQQYNSLQAQYDLLQSEYNQLEQDYLNLQTEYDTLNASYWVLQSEYDACYAELTQLQVDYDALNVSYWALDASYVQLQADYNDLQLALDTLTTWIRQQILPAQYMVFAEAVRRYYFEDFYVQNKWGEGNFSGYWTEFVRFCRDVILHDSQIGYSSLAGSWFPDVSNALADSLRYGNQTELLAFENFWWVLWPWIPNWAGFNLPVNELNAIAQVVQWCVDEIDYEYDTDITRSQELYSWDYIKFPVETAFRTMGDCEDQAILTAAYLESCGFDTMIVVIHDPEWNYGQGLYHGVPMIWWNNTWGARPSETWGFYYGYNDPMPYGEGWWMFLDTTWDTPFGTDPAWLQYYKDTDIYRVFNYEVFSYAVCDYNGWVSYASGGAGGAPAVSF